MVLGKKDLKIENDKKIKSFDINVSLPLKNKCLKLSAFSQASSKFTQKSHDYFSTTGIWGQLAICDSFTL
jgi:hypothetical protein